MVNRLCTRTWSRWLSSRYNKTCRRRRMDSAFFAEWKSKNPDKVLDDNDFFILGEVYGYSLDNDRIYDFGDRKVDYYAHGFDNLINFQFKKDAAQLSYEELFSKYSGILSTKLAGKSVTNYISSHDDTTPFDREREKPYASATKLLLTPGISQIYYGDETARSIFVQNALGDATLRSFMNWDDLKTEDTKTLLSHWQKLGVFRRDHPAIGAGLHQMISETPYAFSRSFEKNGIIDKVIIGLDLQKGQKTFDNSGVFKEGTVLIDYYSGTETAVSNDKISFNSDFDIVLLAPKK